MIFSEISTEWFNNNYATASYGYRAEIRSCVDCLNSFFGQREIGNIKPRDIDAMIASLAIRNPNTGKPMAKKTLKKRLQTAVHIFNYAVDNELIVKNPAKGKKPPANALVTRRRALTEKEQRLILNTPHRAQLAALTIMTVGLRRGELIPLEWQDIDWETNMVHVGKSVYRLPSTTLGIKEGTKNGSCRISAIPVFLIEILKKAYAETNGIYVCSQLNGNMHTLSSWKTMWKSYQTTLNLAATNDPSRSLFDPKGVPKILSPITPHMLRHTCATLMWSAGVDVKTAAKQLGHKDIKVTLEIYTHLAQSKQQLSIGQYDAYLNEYIYK